MPGVVEGRPALLVVDPGRPDAAPAYFMLLEWSDDGVTSIRDFRHASYVIDGADYRLSAVDLARPLRDQPCRALVAGINPEPAQARR